MITKKEMMDAIRSSTHQYGNSSNDIISNYDDSDNEPINWAWEWEINHRVDEMRGK